MQRDGLKTFGAVGAQLACLLSLLFTLSGCTGGQSGHEGAGLDGPSGVSDDAGPVGGGPADGPTMPTDGGEPNDFGNRDGAISDEDGGATHDARDQDAGHVADGGGAVVPIEPSLHGNEHVCADSSIDAPLDCLDVCGTLSICDPSIACDDCLQQCTASRVGPIAGHRCLSRVVYLIDEEGCAAMVRAYQGYLVEASCGE
jgi:hypothetical protein